MPPSECVWSVPVLEDKMSALIRPSPPLSKLSRLLGGCAACVFFCHANRPCEFRRKKSLRVDKVGFSFSWLDTNVQTSLHFVFAQCTSNLHIAICFFSFFFFFCQGQRLGCRNRPCTAGVTNIYAVSATMTILAMWCRGFNFRSRDCVSHQSLLQTKHLLIIINKRCGRLRLPALFSLQVCFLLGFFPVLPFFSRTCNSASYATYRKKNLEVFLQPACIKISGWGTHIKVSPSSEILEQTTEFQLGAAHTHACIHTRGSAWTQTPCLQS